jgi:hypothetical protein
MTESYDLVHFLEGGFYFGNRFWCIGIGQGCIEVRLALLIPHRRK